MEVGKTKRQFFTHGPDNRWRAYSVQPSDKQDCRRTNSTNAVIAVTKQRTCCCGLSKGAIFSIIATLLISGVILMVNLMKRKEA